MYLTVVYTKKETDLFSICESTCVHAKSLQLCLTVSNPMDCRPPGSSVQGILQARILEPVPCPPPGDLPDSDQTHVSYGSWIVGGFFTTEQPGKPCVSTLHACMLSRLSHVQLCVTPWTAAHQAPLSTGFSRQEYWSGLPFPSPVDPHYTINKLRFLF